MASPDQPDGLTIRSAKVKYASRLATRSFRSEHREFLAEGPQAVREALKDPGTVVEVFVTSEAAARYPDLVPSDVVVHETDDRVLKAIADTVQPQGIVARCRFLDRSLADVLAKPLRLVVICADIRDPGNAGTVVRCADAAGADAVIFTGNSVDPFNPKSVRASVGSVFHIPLVIESDTSDVTAQLKAAGLTILAADGGGDLDLFDDEAVLSKPSAWLMGNEAWGLPEDIAALADHTVSIPIFGQAESLNLATATAVCLYASARAHRTR
ncbi:MAG: RNA methyltransferase [Aeromicrobium sp.]